MTGGDNGSTFGWRLVPGGDPDAAEPLTPEAAAVTPRRRPSPAPAQPALAAPPSVPPSATPPTSATPPGPAAPAASLPEPTRRDPQPFIPEPARLEPGFPAPVSASSAAPYSPPALVPPVLDPGLADTRPALPKAPSFGGSFASPSVTWEPHVPPPVEEALDAPAAVQGAQPVGLPDPVGEGIAPSPLESLFTPPLPASTLPVQVEPPLKRPRERGTAKARPVLTRPARIALWVAGCLVAVLLLITIFVLASRLAAPPATDTGDDAPAGEIVPSDPLAGPVAAGEHPWTDLNGGECLEPFESPWQETFIVVDCTTPHAAQLVGRGTFTDAPDAAFPGTDELQGRINLLCTSPTVIDLAAAGDVTDIQVAASYAADETQWAEADGRAFSCFANRASGEPLTASIAAVPPA